MSGECLTGEQRFSKAWHRFRLWANGRKKEEKEEGSAGDDQQEWLACMKAIKAHYGLTHTVDDHIKNGTNMSVSELVKLCHYAFSYYDTDWERVMVWHNVGTLLFYHTKECEDLNFHPFSRPLNEVVNEKVDEKAKKLADLQIRCYEIMKK